MDRTWNTQEAATYIGCTPGTLRIWVSRRRVPFLKVGRLCRFRNHDLDCWLDEQAVRAEGGAR